MTAMTGMQLAALILVVVGTVGVVVTFILMRRKLEDLRRLREEMRR
jgi:hypothetical protein